MIPALFEASVMASKVCRSINIQYFYNLLFTTVNLKLVHIVCHDKTQHDSAKCDPKLYLEDEQVGLWPYSIPKEKTPSDDQFLSMVCMSTTPLPGALIASLAYQSQCAELVSFFWNVV